MGGRETQLLGVCVKSQPVEETKVADRKIGHYYSKQPQEAAVKPS